MRHGSLFFLISLLFFIPADAMRYQMRLQKTFWKNYHLSKDKLKELRRPKTIKRTVSLIVPCYHKHATWLYNLLAMYEHQTRLPDEVVISLSEAHLVKPQVLDRLVNEQWAFPVTLILTDDQKNAGENRNIACAHAKGDILVCQDADDIVHNQRLEIIHYFFTHYAIDHLMHEFQMMHVGDKKVKFQTIAPRKIRFLNLTNFELIWRVARFTNGNVAISRKLFEKVQWPTHNYGEDSDFNRAVYKNCSAKCIVIKAILYGYRQYLSSHAKHVKKEVQVDVAHEVVYTKKPNQSHPVEVVRLDI